MKYILIVLIMTVPAIARGALPSSMQQAAPVDTSMYQIIPDTPAEQQKISDQAVTPEAPPLQPESGMTTQLYPPAAEPQPAMMQPTAPMQPMAEVKTEQFAWPDTVSFTENQQDMSSSDKEAIIIAFRKSNQTLDEMNTIVQQLAKSRADLYQKYFDIDTQIEDFLQKANIDLGETRTEELQEGTSTPPPPAIPQPSDPAIVQVNQEMSTINNNKSSLKKTLIKCDDVVDKAKMLTLNTRKRAVEILKQEAESSAQALLNDIATHLQTLQKMHNDFKTQLTQEFEKISSSITTTIQTTLNILSQLQAKATSHQAEEIQQAQVQPPQVPSEQNSSLQAHPIQAQIPLARSPSKPSYAHYLLNRISSLAVGGYAIGHDTYITIKNKFLSFTEKSNTLNSATSYGGAMYNKYIAPTIMRIKTDVSNKVHKKQPLSSFKEASEHSVSVPQMPLSSADNISTGSNKKEETL